MTQTSRGMPLLGLPQHRLGQGAVAGIVQTGPQQVQADRPQLVELRRLGQGLQARSAGPPCRVDRGRSAARCARGRGRRRGRPRSSRAAPAASARFAAADRRPVVQRRGQGQRHRRRAGLDPRPRLGRRQAGQIDPGLAEGVGVGARRWPSRPGRRPRPSGCRPGDRAAPCRARAASSPAWISVRRASEPGRGASDRRRLRPARRRPAPTCQRARSSGCARAWSRSVRRPRPDRRRGRAVGAGPARCWR